MRETFDVVPIGIGVQSTVVIKYGPEISAAAPLLSGRLKAAFKNKGASAILFTLDSDLVPAAFTRTALTNDVDGAAVSISANLTSVQTALITGNTVVFDILCYGTGETFRLPGYWEWPAVKTVTPV